ncbi:MAG: glucosamine-6-phosphate synthase, partial [Acidimicrobiia bacterium]|nr:glucosamine-6-phosphate synthase [Acidimicrobiia bacterium]
MCGIIAIVRRRSSRPTPDVDELRGRLAAALELLPEPGDVDLAQRLSSIAVDLAALDRELRGEAGLRALLNDRVLPSAVAAGAKEITAAVEGIEAHLERDGDRLAALEAINAGIVDIKDAVWSLERDRLRAAEEVTQLAGTDLTPAAVASFFSIQQALSNLDRLEVRGRDSAGIHILVRNHGVDLTSPIATRLLAARTDDPLFTHGSVRTPDGHLGFVYKAAAEIGELGDNTAAMRAAISADELLQLALRGDDAEATVLGHTRWASVGIISEPNAHPVNSDELAGGGGPYVTGVLNGDVDNFADLIAAERLAIAGEITTDAKVIPTLVSRGLAEGHALDEAVRSSVAQFEGSVAIGISTSGAPEDLHLALRGSGQGVYVGLAEDAFIVASEPYGVVEDSDLYVRMDGETPADPENPTASQGQILRLSGALAGDRAGVTRFAYDGSPLPIDDDEWKQPTVTTRDIDRGDAPHFLLKEISESPISFRKTLRGRLVEEDGRLRVKLPAETVSPEVAGRMADFRRIEVIGQGTAAVAGQAVAAAIGDALHGSGLVVGSITATELSGFHLRDDMSDTLIVAISQSGTTTDTNRTV